MKYMLTVLLISIGSNLNAQLERMGLYAGPSLTVQNYNIYDKPESRGSGFFALSKRFGGFLSFYGDRRFSYETGLLADVTSIPLDRNELFRYSDGLEIQLLEHNYTNVGIPISVMMRTNVTRSCVTYFKLSLINLFTVNERQTVNHRSLPDELSTIEQISKSSKNGVKYFSTDIDFGFGTFWYLKKLGARLCLEPKVTVLQYRNSMDLNHLPNREIMSGHFKLLARIGFEITLYKDLF